MISLWVHQSKNRWTVHCTVKFDLTLFINQILSLWIKMLLILIYKEVFFCIYFTLLSLLLHLDEMGHSVISIYVTLFSVVMFRLRVSLRVSSRVSKKTYSLCKKRRHTTKIIFHRKLYDVIICSVIHNEIKF